MKAIKWYYQTYRPEDFKSHNERRDWTHCRLQRATVHRWMNKFKRTGYHRTVDYHGRFGPDIARPESDNISPIKLTPCEQNELVSIAEEGGGNREAIKDRVKIG